MDFSLQQCPLPTGKNVSHCIVILLIPLLFHEIRSSLRTSITLPNIAFIVLKKQYVRETCITDFVEEMKTLGRGRQNTIQGKSGSLSNEHQVSLRV